MNDGIALQSAPHPWSYERRSFEMLAFALSDIEVEEDGYQTAINLITQYGLQKARLFFIGNGGSAAVASHMACDWGKNAGFATFGPGDAATITCYGNDYGFEHIYSEMIERHGQLGDVLFAISSSGESADILRAANKAHEKRMNVITLSGFDQKNALRGKGQVNFYVPSILYGTVEIAHLAIIHSLLDEVIQKLKATP